MLTCSTKLLTDPPSPSQDNGLAVLRYTRTSWQEAREQGKTLVIFQNRDTESAITHEQTSQGMATYPGSERPTPEEQI
jgi:hypothetical protein